MSGDSEDDRVRRALASTPSEPAPCSRFPKGVTYKTIGLSCPRCNSWQCWRRYLEWERELGITLNWEHQPMKDYRVDYRNEAQFRAVIEENHAKGAPSHFHGYVRGGLPADRKGLIVILHDLIMVQGGTAFWNEMAADVARQTGQRVYIIMTEQRWHMMLFGIVVPVDAKEPEGETHLWYDEYEVMEVAAGVRKRTYANDQFIAHYDPDGTYGFDGAS